LGSPPPTAVRRGSRGGKEGSNDHPLCETQTGLGGGQWTVSAPERGNGNLDFTIRNTHRGRGSQNRRRVLRGEKKEIHGAWGGRRKASKKKMGEKKEESNSQDLQGGVTLFPKQMKDPRQVVDRTLSLGVRITEGACKIRRRSVEA